MKSVTIALIQQHNTPDIHDNMRRLSEKIAMLSQQGAQLIVLQELHDTLYFCQTEDVDTFRHATTIPSERTNFYSSLAREHHIVLVTSLFERHLPGQYFNTAIVFDNDGTIAGRYRKMHIPDDPAYYEKFYFTPGDYGFTPIDTAIGRLGVLVCWDQWFPEAARIMALRGAELLIYPTAIGWTDNDDADEQARQQQAWVTIQRAHAIANGLHVVAVNRVGREQHPINAADGITFWGSSFIAGPQGEIIYQASSTAEATFLTTIDLTRTETVRQWWPFLRDRRVDAYTPLLSKSI